MHINIIYLYSLVSILKATAILRRQQYGQATPGDDDLVIDYIKSQSPLQCRKPVPKPLPMYRRSLQAAYPSLKRAVAGDGTYRPARAAAQLGTVKQTLGSLLQGRPLRQKQRKNDYMYVENMAIEDVNVQMCTNGCSIVSENEVNFNKPQAEEPEEDDEKENAEEEEPEEAEEEEKEEPEEAEAEDDEPAAKASLKCRPRVIYLR